MTRKWNIVSRIKTDADGMQWCPECGCPLLEGRSLEHLRMFHAFIGHCFESWPEDRAFVPDNPEHLRAWLLIKVKHREPHHVFSFASRREQQLGLALLQEEMRADRARGVYGFVTECKGGITILRPASIAIHGAKAITEKRFAEVSDAVFRFVLEFAGIDFQLWKEMGKPRSVA